MSADAAQPARTAPLVIITYFRSQCESVFTSTTLNVKGSIAEYFNTGNQPIIVSTDRRQKVMAVMVGTNGGDLLAYWKQLNWVVP